MASEIDWKARYNDLENQLKDMMYMSLDLIEKSELSQVKATISNIIYTEVDNKLEVTAIVKANNPVFLFEIIDEETKKILIQKSDLRKNSCKFNVYNLSNYRVRISIKNEDDEGFTDTKVTKVLNRFIGNEG